MTQSTEQERAEFEAWWQSDGQFCRAGGGDYEKTFAYHAWMKAASKFRCLDCEDTGVNTRTGYDCSYCFGDFQAARRAPVVLVPQGYKITEEQHVAAVKVLHRAAGADGLPQRMLDAMLAAAPQPQGWKLVPLDPTNGMVLSAAGICSDKNEQDSVKAAYYAMLAAAPQPPEVEIGKEQP